MYLTCLLKISSQVPDLRLEVGVEVREAEGVIALHLKDHRIVWIRSLLLTRGIQIEVKAFLLDIRSLRSKNGGHLTSHLTSLYAFCAAPPTSRAHVGPTWMLRCKILRVLTADFTMSPVCVNPGGIRPHGPIPVTTSLIPPQKFSRKILSEQYKYRTLLETISMLLICVNGTHLLIWVSLTFQEVSQRIINFWGIIKSL